MEYKLPAGIFAWDNVKAAFKSREEVRQRRLCGPFKRFPSQLFCQQTDDSSNPKIKSHNSNTAQPDSVFPALPSEVAGSISNARSNYLRKRAIPLISKVLRFQQDCKDDLKQATGPSQDALLQNG
eukprot:CAMPEP_0175121416 /NCGR_PEP_ID=MMETSP0087-20121206/1154_1 /TAXON_ID=136419 /ORGANISM="Unknown Unknown, Strain D1" /LENGTH=124 /DNA_ID=CAMNT_0016402951 /DNA_START=115 /DNA_END=489 /DNA_ORIENTATION=+